MKALVDPLLHPVFLGRRGIEGNDPYESPHAPTREEWSHPERERPARPVHIDHTVLRLRIDDEEGEIEGEALLSLAAHANPVREIVLDAKDLAVRRVTLAGGGLLAPRRGARKGRAKRAGRTVRERTLAWDQGAESLTIALPRELPPRGTVDLRIAYRARPRTGLHFIRPDREYPDRPRQVWSQNQAEDARHWFPCHDAPDDKGSIEMFLTVREAFTTVANGSLVRVSRGPAKGWRTWHWRNDEPVPAYLVSLVVGDYAFRRSSYRGIPLHYYFYRGKQKEAARLFERTADMMRVFEERFGQPFPFVKYAQTTVSDFTFGGMENVSATTLTEEALADDRAAPDFDYESLVSHELAHSWWGDMVTCRDWPNAWLNESFATFASALYEEAARGKDAMQLRLLHDWNHYMRQDRGEYRRPILSARYGEPIDLFDRHHYQKGAFVLSMLRFVLGDPAFFASLANYLGRHAHGNAETADLLRAIEETTGENLAWFFDQWIEGAGYPEFRVEHAWDVRAKLLTVRVAQTQASAGGNGKAPVFRTPVEIAVRTARGLQTFRVEIRRAEETFVFPLASRPAYVAFDPGNRVLKTLDHRQSRGELLARLSHDPEAPGRLAAARLLVAYPDPEVVRALGRALRSDRARGARMGAAVALGETGAGEALAILLRNLDVDDPWIRRAVVFGVGCHPDPRAHRALARTLEDDPSYLVRATALFGLVHAKHPDAFALLERALGVDSHADLVRGSAFDALAALKDTRALPLAMTWTEYGKPKGARTGAIRCLGALGKGDALVHDRLLVLLEDRMHEVRTAAAGALGALGERKALPALEARLAVEPIDRVRQALRKTVATLSKR